MREATGSRQTGHDVVYFAAQPPQRMCPHGTIAVGLSFGSRQIGHSSESRAGAELEPELIECIECIE